MIANIVSFSLTMAISFFMTPYIKESVGMEAYGLVGLANSVISYGTLITVALNTLAGRFIVIEIHRNNYEKANEYFSSVLIANTVIAVILAIPSIWLICNLDVINVSPSLMFDAQLTFTIVIVGFFVGIVGSVFDVVLLSRNILWKGGFRNAESSVIRIALIVLMFSFLDTRVFYVALATFIAGLYPMCFNIRYTRKYEPELRIRRSSFSIKAIKAITSSGIWESVTRLSKILLEGLDLLLCNIFIGGVMTGNVAIGKTLPGLFVVPLALLGGAFYPQFLEYYSKKMRGALHATINRSIDVLSVISGVGASILIVYSADFYRLWMPGEDEVLLSTITILGLGPFLICGCIDSLYMVFALTNKVKISSIVMVASGFLSVGLTFLCLNYTDWGVYAIVGVSSAVGIVREFLFLPMYAAHCLGVGKHTFYKRIFVNLAIVVVMLCLSYGVKSMMPTDSWTMLITNLAICGILGLSVSWYVVLSKEQRMIITTQIKNKLSALKREFK